MARKPKKKRITTKAVQATEGKPFELPSVPAKPEIDEAPWGDDGLTFKQRRFCEAYVGEASGNATRAAQIAGYRDDNMVTLGGTAHENLKKPQIRAYIGRLLCKLGLTPDFLRSRLAQHAQSSMENFLTVNDAGEVVLDLKQAAHLGALGQLKEFKEEAIEVGENVIKRKVTVKVHDPLPAIRTAMEMQGMLSGTAHEPERVIVRRPMHVGRNNDVGTDNN